MEKGLNILCSNTEKVSVVEKNCGFYIPTGAVMGLSASATSVLEDVGFITVTVNVTSGILEEPVTVTISTVGISAMGMYVCSQTLLV